jgi:hypothetical protein
MSIERKIIPVAGLLATIAIAVYMVVQLKGQGTAVTGDFTNAVTAEVRDAQGQIVLRGQFAVADESDNEIERKATLESTGIDADAAGEAEVEFSKAAPGNQEIEFSVRNLQAGVAITFVIDGTDVGTATADQRGRAEIELDIRMPGTPSSR